MQYTRGSAWFSIVISFGVIAADIKLFEQPIMGILPPWFAIQWLYPAAIVFYLFACYAIGVVDERWGIWKHENDYTFDVTPNSTELLDNSKYIREKIDEAIACSKNQK